MEGSPRQRYDVSYRWNLSPIFPWLPFCKDDKPAFILGGSFTNYGNFVPDNNHISVACEGSAAAKAIRWGFWPTADNLEKNFAAIRMARADYAGTGRAYTIQGTPLRFYDPSGTTAIKGESDLDEAGPDEYDALVLPGGVGNPVTFGMQDNAVQFARAFLDAG